MAFINEHGQKISYNCPELIKELQRDIDEFGGDMLVEAVTKEQHGVKLYIDYNFIDSSAEPTPLSENESLNIMTATALMELLKMENEIL